MKVAHVSDATTQRIRNAVISGSQRLDKTAADRVTNLFLKDNSVDIISAGFSGGQGRPGVENGPQKLLENGLEYQLKGLGWNVTNKPGFPYHPPETRPKDGDDSIGKLKHANYVSNATKKLAELVQESCEQGRLPLTLGGDHSLAIGTLAGSSKVYGSKLGVIWVDAHADINTPNTTDTGNLHGCPLSFLLGLESTDISPFNKWLKPCISPNRLVYIGLRDVDPGERKIIRDHNIKAFSMHEVDKYGIGKIMEMALEYLGNKDPIHLSFDVDAFDPSVVPATGTPVRGGLSFREGHYICEELYDSGSLVAVDIMEVNPLLAQSEAELIQTVKIGCSLARTSLGETLLW